MKTGPPVAPFDPVISGEVSESPSRRYLNLISNDSCKLEFLLFVRVRSLRYMACGLSFQLYKFRIVILAFP